MSILLLAWISVLSFGGETKDVTIFGITLGKSLEEVGIHKCEHKPSIHGNLWITLHNYPDVDCYVEGGDYADAPAIQQRGGIQKEERQWCSTQVIKKLSFPVIVMPVLLTECDRQSPVQEIQVTFYSDNYSKILSLMKDKFGKPNKTERSSVQNKMGARFTKQEAFWVTKKYSIYLSNITSEDIDNGIIRIIHADKIHQYDEESKNKDKNDRDKF